MGKFKKDGAAALMHVVMIGSNERDQVMIGAASPAALKKALLDLTGIHAADSAISHVAVCDAGLAGLLQAEGVGQ
jgi:hypothetical protein